MFHQVQVYGHHPDERSAYIRRYPQKEHTHYATEIEEPITTTNEPQIEENEETEEDYQEEIILLLMGILAVEIIGVIIK